MNKDKVPLFNPLNEDFTAKYDINNDRNPIAFTIKAKSVAYFDPPIAAHIKKHLATAIFEKRGNNKMDHDIQIEQFLKEIETI